MQSTLIESLTVLNRYLPDCWLIPCDGNKKPAGGHLDSNARYITPDGLRQSLKKGELNLPCWYDYKTKDSKVTKNVASYVKGYKLNTGKLCTYQGAKVALIALDVDGEDAGQFLLELQAGAAFPKTVSWTSGRPGRRTHLFWTPAGKMDRLKPKTKHRDLELIAGWPGVVMPPSQHPTQGYYTFLEGQSFAETAIAELPDFLFEYGENRPKIKKLEDIKLPTTTEIPLFNCLDEETRRLIQQGVPAASGHNEAALRVSAVLLGTENYLDSIGQPFQDDAETLFRDFLRASGVGDGDREMSRFKLSERKRTEFDCVTEAVDNCIRGWEWTTVLKNKPLPAASLAILSSNLWDDIKALYHSAQSVQDIDAGKKRLASIHKVELREVDRLYKEIAEEEEASLRFDISRESFVEFIKAKESVVNIHAILPPAIAQELEVIAKTKYHPSRTLTYIWPAIGGLVGAKVRVAANARSAWYSDLIFYCVDIGLKGTGKSAAGEDVFGYLLKREKEQVDAHKRQVEVLETLEKQWEDMSPEERRHHSENPDVNPALFAQRLGPEPKTIFDSPTIPAVIKYLGRQPKWRFGVLFNDELASLFAGFNQYNSRGGNDRQFWLEFFNGRSWKRLERVTDTPGVLRELSGQSMQVCGGMQPEAYKKYLNLSSSQDGLTDRFLINYPPQIAPPDALPQEGFSIPPVLAKAYDRLSSIDVELEDNGSIVPTIIDWEPAAYQFWERCYVTLKHIGADLRVKNQDFSGYTSKLITYFPRIAGALSLLWQASEPGEDALVPSPIPLHVAEKTWVLIQHYAYQYLAMQIVGEEQGFSDANLDRVWEMVKDAGSVTPREVVRRLGGRRIDGKQIDSKIAAELLNRLAAAGFGTIEKTKGSIRLKYAQPESKLLGDTLLQLREAEKPLAVGDRVTWTKTNQSGVISYVDETLRMAYVEIDGAFPEVPFDELRRQA